MAKNYIRKPVGRRELKSLVDLARVEERAFFIRNPHLVARYRNRLLAVALCQGAALQFLGEGYGVNDFDIHFFYSQNPEKRRLSRTVRRVHANVGRFPGVPVDFIRTVVPSKVATGRLSPAKTIQAFLRQRPTSNAVHLARKAAVGLLPAPLFGITLWRKEWSNKALHATRARGPRA